MRGVKFLLSVLQEKIVNNFWLLKCNAQLHVSSCRKLSNIEVACCDNAYLYTFKINSVMKDGQQRFMIKH